MNKLELLVTLVRAIDNSPKGKFTIWGPEPNGTGDIKRPRPGVLGRVHAPPSADPPTPP